MTVGWLAGIYNFSEGTFLRFLHGYFSVTTCTFIFTFLGGSFWFTIYIYLLGLRLMIINSALSKLAGIFN